MITKEQREAIRDQFAQHERDTGSCEVQVGVLTERIKELTTHLSEHRHDYQARMGLLKLVGQRRRFLRYLQKHRPDRYQALVEELGLRG